MTSNRRTLVQSRAKALAGPFAATGMRAAKAATDDTVGSGDDAAPKVAELWLYGVVGGWWFGFSSDSVARALRGLEVDEIVVRLDSPGGNAHQGISIANLLANHPAKVTVVVDGLAASAASMIALAGDEVVMSPGSQFMLHDAWMLTIGNAADLRSDADWLDKQSQNYAETYAHRTDADAAHWRGVMLADDGRGTWYTAQESVAAGLADRVGNIATSTPPPADPAEDSDLDEDEMSARAAWDLDVLIHPSARAAWTDRHPNAHAPKPPSASAVGSTHTEGGSAVAFSDEQLTAMRAKLGLSETADEASILAAVETVVDESLEEKPETAPKAASVPDGMSLVDSTVLDQLRSDAQQGREARQHQRDQERDNAIDAAVRDGRTSPTRRDHWAKAWDADSEGTKTLLDSLEPGLVAPTSEAGHAAEPTDIVVDDAELETLAASLGLSKEDLRG